MESIIHDYHKMIIIYNKNEQNTEYNTYKTYKTYLIVDKVNL